MPIKKSFSFIEGTRRRDLKIFWKIQLPIFWFPFYLQKFGRGFLWISGFMSWDMSWHFATDSTVFCYLLLILEIPFLILFTCCIQVLFESWMANGTWTCLYGRYIHAEINGVAHVKFQHSCSFKLLNSFSFFSFLALT